jgi:hypothetical protein
LDGLANKSQSKLFVSRPTNRWKLLWQNIKSSRCLFDAVKILWRHYHLTYYHYILRNHLLLFKLFCIFMLGFGLVWHVVVLHLYSFFTFFHLYGRISILFRIGPGVKVDPILTCIKFQILLLNFDFHNNYAENLTIFLSFHLFISFLYHPYLFHVKLDNRSHLFLQFYVYKASVMLIKMKVHHYSLFIHFHSTSNLVY